MSPSTVHVTVEKLSSLKKFDMERTSTTSPVTCPPVTPDEFEIFGTKWLEQKVIGFFRLWHVIFLCIGGTLTLIILVCCMIRVRIPRTKQDIEADFKRKKITKKFRKHLDKLPIEDTNLKFALERVTERVGIEAQENLENGAAPTSDTPATSPGSTRSLANAIITPNSVPKLATTSVQPQTSQSSTDEEPMTSAQSARMKLRKALFKAKQQQINQIEVVQISSEA